MEDRIIDLEDALDRVQDDKELLLELFDIFEADFRVKRKELDKYLKEKNTEMVRNIAHSVKGASGNISAQRIRNLCLLMEESASKGNLDPVPEALIQLDKAFADYQKEAQKIKDDYQVL